MPEQRPNPNLPIRIVGVVSIILIKFITIAIKLDKRNARLGPPTRVENFTATKYPQAIPRGPVTRQRTTGLKYVTSSHWSFSANI